MNSARISPEKTSKKRIDAQTRASIRLFGALCLFYGVRQGNPLSLRKIAPKASRAVRRKSPTGLLCSIRTAKALAAVARVTITVGTNLDPLEFAFGTAAVEAAARYAAADALLSALGSTHALIRLLFPVRSSPLRSE